RGADAGRLDRMIARAGGTPVGGTVLFRTADFADAPGLFRQLGTAGIHVRRFAEAPARLRFGLPADRNAWCRLSRILR
ncbi:threonine-phosphate decarboxylase, partial [Methylobacterium sp. WL93]